MIKVIKETKDTEKTGGKLLGRKQSHLIVSDGDMEKMFNDLESHVTEMKVSSKKET